MKVDLDRRENLDGFQKLVSTLRTVSISISICLDVETTKATFYTIDLKVEILSHSSTLSEVKTFWVFLTKILISL
jgi:hypothetical protein